MTRRESASEQIQLISDAHSKSLRFVENVYEQESEEKFDEVEVVTGLGLDHGR